MKHVFYSAVTLTVMLISLAGCATAPPAPAPPGAYESVESEPVEAAQDEPTTIVDSPSAATVQPPSNKWELEKLIRFVEGELNTFYESGFRDAGYVYRRPVVVVWSSSSAIVFASGHTRDPQAGPFYDPQTESIYYPEHHLWTGAQMNNPDDVGDGAVAYILAHEFGHHVQKLLGSWEVYRAARERALTQAEGDKLSQEFELQADCLAGAWSGVVRSRIFERGDLEEALDQSFLVGDDVLSGQLGDHGTGQMRREWFFRGFNSGFLACATSNHEPTQPAPTEMPQPGVWIDAVSLDHNWIEASETGLRIRVNLRTSNLLGRQIAIGARFYFAEGAPLMDFNQRYASADGTVSVWTDITPGLDHTTYDDLTLFIPYRELEMGATPAGTYEMKLDVAAYDYVQRVIVATSDYQPFQFSQ